MVTIYDIAKACNVAPSTVSKVLNDYPGITEKTRKKIQKAIDELNYIPNESASSLSKGKTNNVGILAYFGSGISPFKHSLFAQILDSFQEEMNKSNYDLLFVSKNVRGRDETFLKNCISRGVDGVLLFGNLKMPELKEVIESGLPSVAFDYFGSKTCGVSSDNYESTCNLVQYIINMGHKKIAYMYGDRENDVTNIRKNAYKDTLIKNQIPFDKSLLVESRYYESHSLKNILFELYDKEVTCVICPDDYVAISAIKIFKDQGISVPEDISIAGFDGLEIGQLFSPSLTTVQQNTQKIGKALAKNLLEILKTGKKNNDKIVVPATLLTGESVGKIS